MLAGVVAELDEKGLLEESDGAAVRLPARVHRPRRRAAAAHRAQGRRRLQLRDDRPRGGARPGRAARCDAARLRRRRAAGAALRDGVRRSRAGRLAGAAARAASTWRSATCWARTARCCDPRAGETRAPGRPAGRGRAARAAVGRRAQRRARRPTSARRSRAPSASARSSTPTCPATGSSDYVFDWDRMLVARRQHGALPAVRARPDPLDLPPRGRGRWTRQGRRADARRARGARPGARAAWASPPAVRESIERLAPHRLCS